MQRDQDSLPQANLADEITIDFPGGSESSVSINRFGETILKSELEDTATGDATSATAVRVESLGKYEVIGMIGRGLSERCIALTIGSSTVMSRSKCRMWPRREPAAAPVIEPPRS